MTILEFQQWINSSGAFIGGLAAALSVLYAVYSLNKSNEEKIIDRLKIISVETKSSLQKIDRNLAWPLFLEIEEIFRSKVSASVGSFSTKDDLRKKFESEALRLRMPRMITLAVAESSLTDSLRKEIDGLQVSYVELAQRFPVSAETLRLCTLLIDNMFRHLTGNTGLYDDALSENNRSKFFDNFSGAEREELLIYFSADLSDMPMNYLREKGQRIINDAISIMEVITDSLAKKDFSKLKRLQRAEEKALDSVIDATATITAAVHKSLAVLRPHLSDAEWVKAYAAVVRLESLFGEKTAT